MSALLPTSRRAPLLFATSRAQAAAGSAVPALQTRHKSGGKQKSPPKNAAKVKGDPREMMPQKREKRPGAFVALSAASLQNPIFRNAKRPELDLPTFASDKIVAGQAVGFDLAENDPARKFGVPRSMLVEFRQLSKPCSVVRDVTVTTTNALEKAAGQSSSETRLVLTGSAGSGKSFVLLQALEYCVSKQWIVLYVPRAISLVNSSSAYQYDMRTQTYSQPTFASQTLRRFLAVNAAALKNMTTQKEVGIERRASLPAGTSLVDLINVGLKDQSVAPTVLEALLSELGSQKDRPVLLAIDDFQALYCESTYRDPLFARIKSYHLSMPRLLLDYASGKKTFARGAVVGAVSSHDTTFRTPIELSEALNVPHYGSVGPYTKRSSALQEYAKGLRAVPVPEKLSVAEAASLFEVWMRDLAVPGVSEDGRSASDSVFLAKYTESSGNARDFVQKGLLSSLAYA